jgi:hypothetical protein
MNKLWVFGCSFATGFNAPIDEYNAVYPNEMIWPGILANKLNLELINMAHAGQCNWVNILHFVDRRNEIQPGDIVIFEFTFFDRYNVYPHRAQLQDLEHFFVKHRSDMNDVIAFYRDVNYKWFEKQVLQWCEKHTIDLYCISAEGQTHSDFEKYKQIVNFITAPNHTESNPNYSFYTMWQDNCKEQWIQYSDGTSDKHFNPLGHKRLANHIFEHIYIKQIL